MSHSDHEHPDPHVPAPHEAYTHHHDAGEDHWYDHDPAEHPQEPHAQEVNSKVLGVWMAVVIASTFATVLALVWIFEQFSEREETAKTEVYTGQNYIDITTQARSELATAGWIDAEAGIVRIPIDDAMDRVVSEYQQMQRGNAAQ